MKFLVLLVTVLSMVIAVVATSRKSIVIPLRRHNSRTNSSISSNSFQYDGKDATFEKRNGMYLKQNLDFYYGYFEIGRTKVTQEFRLIINTSTRRLWVMGTDCREPGCKEKVRYNSKGSRLVLPQDRVRLDHNRCQGTEYDNLVSAGKWLKADSRIFVCHWISDIYAGTIIDGEIGFAYNYPKHPHRVVQQVPQHEWRRRPTFFQNLFTTSAIAKGIFGLYISRSYVGSELILGDYNHELANHGLHNVTVQSPEHWIIHFDSLNVNEINIFPQRPALIHTALQSINVPPLDATEFYNALPNAREIPDPPFWEVPCNHIPNIVFNLTNVVIPVYGPDLIMSEENGFCRLAIVGDNNVGETWHLGAPFLKNVYTVFDWDDAKIAFSPLPFPNER